MTIAQHRSAPIFRSRVPPRPSPMLRTALLTLWCLLLAVGGGAASAWYVLQRPAFDSIVVGSWVAQPGAGLGRSDPYSRARVAVAEVLALSQSEGIAFTATRDSSGKRLRSACRYRIAGELPAARVWTLHAGRGRPGLSSLSALFQSSGRIEILAGRHPEPGNWLRMGPEERPTFTFTFYDPDLAATAAAKGISLPSIERVSCDA
jgi:hypothetical protein